MYLLGVLGVLSGTRPGGAVIASSRILPAALAHRSVSHREWHAVIIVGGCHDPLSGDNAVPASSVRGRGIVSSGTGTLRRPI